jgi:hypothetical protein
MDSVLAQMTTAVGHGLGHQDGDVAQDAAAWGSMAGFGNLTNTGGVNGMQVPRVPDVSSIHRAGTRLTRA